MKDVFPTLGSPSKRMVTGIGSSAMFEALESSVSWKIGVDDTEEESLLAEAERAPGEAFFERILLRCSFVCWSWQFDFVF
jgi:hypothetical protein